MSDALPRRPDPVPDDEQPTHLKRSITAEGHRSAIALVQAHTRGDLEAVRHLWPEDVSDVEALHDLVKALVVLAAAVSVTADDAFDKPRGTTAEAYQTLLLRAQAS